MRAEFRQKLAVLPFEEKIRKVGELIRLSRKVKSQPRTLSELKDTTAMAVFISERNRERKRERG